MELLRQERERKRKELAEKLSEKKGRKYVKRSELERIEIKRDTQKDETLISPTTTPTKGQDSLFSPTSLPETSSLFDIPRNEVVRRLRERVEPIRLFGETDEEACLRLKQIEILAPEINKGMRNDFKAAFDRLDQEELDLLARQQGGDVSSAAGGTGEAVDIRISDDGYTMSDIELLCSEVGKGDEDKDQEVVQAVLSFLLKEWGRQLNSRSYHVKRSTQGKLLSATFKQTEGYLDPLFKMLKKKTTQPDILKFLSQICLFLVQREYVKANDSYLQMSIGNSPWPIGVTMVGIHARTGREKIFSQSIAHVLNDETQRKYIQGVKRLMTFCQQRYETDPSKSVEYKGIYK